MLYVILLILLNHSPTYKSGVYYIVSVPPVKLLLSETFVIKKYQYSISIIYKPTNNDSDIQKEIHREVYDQIK